MGKSYEEASSLIEEMASSAYNWSCERTKLKVAMQENEAMSQLIA